MRKEYSEEINAACRLSFDAFAQRAFQEVEPATLYEYNWHIGCLSEHLEALYRGDITRLIINMPPRFLKSYLVARAFPAWVMGREASSKFICASYGYEVAEQNSLACRRIMKSDWYQSCFPETKIGTLDRNTHFETTDSGQYYATSALSPLTGLGCFVAGTKILTNKGEVDIEELNSCKDTLILSYSHDENKLVYSQLGGFIEKESEDIVEIQTDSGRKITCTSNHPIFTQDNGYREAGSLRAGERLVCPDTATMQSMRKEVYNTSSRHKKEDKKGLFRRILHSGMFTFSSRNKERKEVRNLWNTDVSSWRSPFLFKGMQAVVQETQEQRMLELQNRVYSNLIEKILLLGRMCKCFTFKENERERKFKQQEQNNCKLGYDSTETIRHEKEWIRVCDLQEIISKRNWKKGEPLCSSYRRESEQQRYVEPDNSMSFLSCDTSQVTFDTISSVKKISSEKTKVYDLTISNTHNFFANGALVHNCNYFVCDDLLKPNEALSETIRNSTNENMRNTFFSRFNDKRTGKFLMVSQRLHEDDPAGNLLADGGYTHLKLPAEAKKPVLITLGDNYWAMKEGDLLSPDRLSREILDQDLRDMGAYNFAGQMMQDPVPAGGGEFSDKWVQYYDEGGIKPSEMNIYILVDAAGGDEINKKKKKTSDWTAMMVVGLGNDNNYYLLDMVRDRLNPTERIKTLFDLHRKWNDLSGKPPKVGYEKYGLMTDTYYIRETQKELAYRFPMEELGGKISKEERIRMLIPDFENGRWYFPPNLMYKDSEGRTFNLVSELVKSEMGSFPKARFDDMLDALARIKDDKLNAIFPRLKVGKVQSIIEKRNRNKTVDWINA